MDDQTIPDVLGELGLRPTELGSIQAHLAGVWRTGERSGFATLWLQAAFDPVPEEGHATLRAANGDLLARERLPPLRGGRAVQWTIPLPVPADVDVVSCEIEAPVQERAKRIREPWRLLDTLEVLPDQEPRSVSLGAVAITGALFPTLGVLAISRAALPRFRPPPSLHRHAARPNTGGLSTPVRNFTGAAAPLVPRIETIWEEGSGPLEPSRWRQEALPLAPGERRCGCGASNPAHVEFCHSCLATLEGASAMSAVALPPPRDAMPAATEPASQQVTSLNQGHTCPHHPLNSEVLTCPRCGSFYCEDCFPGSLRSERDACPACRTRELNPRSEGNRHQMFREMAFTLYAIAGVLAGLTFLPLILGTLHSKVDLGDFSLVDGLVPSIAVFLLGTLPALFRHVAAGWIAVLGCSALGLLAFLVGAFFLAGLMILGTFILVMLLLRLKHGGPAVAEG